RQDRLMHDAAPSFHHLLERARGGDSRAFGQLLERYWAPLRRCAGAEPEPSDMVQDTMLDAWKELPGFRGQTEVDFWNWLQATLASNGKDAGRKRGAIKRGGGQATHSLDQGGADGRALADRVPSGDATPSGNAMRVEEAQRLRRLLDQLPADQAQ